MSIFKLLTVLIVIVAILLIGVILLQEPKERVTPSGGGAASIQRIGINQKADFLEKTTWVLVGLLLFLTFLSSIFLKDVPQSNLLMSPNLAKLQEEQPLSSMVVPDATGDATAKSSTVVSDATSDATAKSSTVVSDTTGDETHKP